MQVLEGETGFSEKMGEAFIYFQDFLSVYGDRFRNFRHGVLHVVMSRFIFVLPVLSIVAMFERNSAKCVAMNTGFWIVTLAIMEGIICQWI